MDLVVGLALSAGVVVSALLAFVVSVRLFGRTRQGRTAAPVFHLRTLRHCLNGWSGKYVRVRSTPSGSRLDVAPAEVGRNGPSKP